jgi:hypothetical protein
VNDERPRSRIGRLLQWLTPEARDEDWLDPGDDEPGSSLNGLAARVAALEAEISDLKGAASPAIPE